MVICFWVREGIDCCQEMEDSGYLFCLVPVDCSGGWVCSKEDMMDLQVFLY